MANDIDFSTTPPTVNLDVRSMETLLEDKDVILYNDGDIADRICLWVYGTLKTYVGAPEGEVLEYNYRTTVTNVRATINDMIVVIGDQILEEKH